MAILLAAGINATQNRVTLTEPLTAAPGDLFRIDNEVVEFGGYGRMAGGRLVDHSRKIVSFGRGVNGTTAATHTATTAVLRVVDGLVSAVGAPDPFVTAGGGGSVTVADADPGAVGAGGLWLQTDAAGGGPEYVRLWVRNSTDDGWLATGPISNLDGDVHILAGPSDSIEVVMDEDNDEIALTGAATIRLAGNVALGAGVQSPQIRWGQVDPSAGAGLAAQVGTAYLRQTAEDGTGSLWQKVDDTDTGWVQVGFTDSSLAAYAAAGAIELTSAGGISLIADVLADINLAGQALRLNGDFIAKEAYVDAAIAAAIDAPLTANLDVGGFTIEATGADDLTFESANDINALADDGFALEAGGLFSLQGATLKIDAAGGAGAAGQFLGSNGASRTTWQTPIVRTAAGAPAGAPGVGELPFAYDTTAVTGGFYYWDGAAWVKVATIL